MVHATKNNETPGGKLYICSTPIGHLADSSERLLQTLRTVDIVACEDTRHTRKLLTHFDIHPPKLVSYHEHNEASRQHMLLDAVAEGQSIAIVSDAGTPLLSDPGRVIVDSAIEAGFPVIPVPGPSALLAAMVASGLPFTPFLYLGFAPRNKRGLRKWLAPFRALDVTFVIYESPHRLRSTVSILAEELGAKNAVLAKELTKQHETFIRGTLPELAEYVETEGARGEYVIVVDNRDSDGDGNRVVKGLDDAAGDDEQSSGAKAGDEAAEVLADPWRLAVAHVEQRMAEGMRHKEAVQEAVGMFGVHRRDLYNETLKGGAGEA